jgi:putative phosphoribosyl transferase
MIPFRDRTEAGRALAVLLSEYAGRHEVVVLALPRGGVPVAYQVATAIRAPLDILAVRKLGVPGHEELALGAIASGGIAVLNAPLAAALELAPADVVRVVQQERRELKRRQRLYRDHRPYPAIYGKIVLLVDDGLATGASMHVALRTLRRKHPAKLVVAVPVAPQDTCEVLRRDADDIVCCEMPEPFDGVGASYLDFSQVTDDEVRDLLRRAAMEQAS